MRSDPRELHGEAYDLVVVGAGIQGAAMAREAALRGLRVLLLDARDVGAGTSSRSSRLVHGGLRYLRQGHLALVREALHERERLLRLAPHLVRPLPMLMPFFADGGGAPWTMWLGTMAYSLLAGRSTLPRPRRLTAAAAAQAFPGLRTRGLRSALEFFDARTQDTRLTLANVLDAAAHGCAVATHTEAVRWRDGALQLVDRVRGDEVTVHSRHVVNAAGPRADDLRQRLGIDRPALLRLSRGSHVVLPPRPGELALAAFLPDDRIQFVIPHAGGTLCGTTDVDDALAGDEGGPPGADLDYLRGSLGFLLEPPPAPADFGFAYAGWRALPAAAGPPGALHREAFVIEESLGAAGDDARLATIVGGKLTTHRSFAERTIARLFGLQGPSPSRHAALPGGLGPREVDDPLWWRHGSRVALLRALVASEPALREPLCAHRPFVAAELVLALRDEGAVTFADAMLRRLVHPLGPCTETRCLERAHALFLRERRWPADSQRDVAIGSLRAELRRMTGELVLWQAAQTGVSRS